MILHVDLDAFYASVEQRDHPELRGKPVLVGSASRRGVVLAASYESRPFGCKSAMPMGEARRLCPQAIIVPPRMEAYAAVSAKFRDVLDAFTPIVEPISIDEAFLDVSGTERLHGPPVEVARAIKRRVREELELTASVGVAAIKMVAKIASDLGKPDGLVVVPADGSRAFLAPLPIERLFGVGPKTAKILRGLGLETLGQVARHPIEALAARLGASHAVELQARARGEDARHVEADRAAVSIGAEDTFEHDLEDGPLLRRRITAQAERVAERLRRSAQLCGCVVLKLKDPEFQVTSRRRTLPAATSDGRLIAKVALELLDASKVRAPGVRLSGVSATSLSPADAPRQLTLDEPVRARGERLGETLDKIRDKFGRDAVARATLLSDED
ncbi:MAG: polymerase [bacterium]|nr:polymerase [bacterium]